MLTLKVGLFWDTQANFNLLNVFKNIQPSHVNIMEYILYVTTFREQELAS